MRIGILTGGGDVPGLNACIKTVVNRAAERGWEVVGFRRGWAGPLNCNPDDPASFTEHMYTLDRNAVRSIDRTGGTVLHTSRTDPASLHANRLPEFLAGRFEPNAKGRYDVTPHIVRVIEKAGLDAIITIGGDGTLTFSARLHKEGVPVMSIPKTMDNDVHGTDFCIGFSTAVSRSVDYIHQLRTTVGSHERIAVVELFGRNSGETALIAGYLADADRALIAEVPFEIDAVWQMLARDRADNPANYAILVVSEGARMKDGDQISDGIVDAEGHRRLGGIGEVIGQEIARRSGIGVIVQRLGYLMRAGAPDALDQMVAKSYGTMAVQLLAEGKSGLMMALRDGNYEPVPADTCIQAKKRVDVAALYDPQAYRPRIARVMGKPMFLY